MRKTESRQIISDCLRDSRRDGMDLWEVMEIRKVLLTDARKRELKSEALAHLLYVLGAESAERVLQRYLGGRPATAQDMFDAMMEWLKDYKEGVEAGHVV